MSNKKHTRQAPSPTNYTSEELDTLFTAINLIRGNSPTGYEIWTALHVLNVMQANYSWKHGHRWRSSYACWVKSHLTKKDTNT
jgi:hypothetical protein